MSDPFCDLIEDIAREVIKDVARKEIQERVSQAVRDLWKAKKKLEITYYRFIVGRAPGWKDNVRWWPYIVFGEKVEEGKRSDPKDTPLACRTRAARLKDEFRDALLEEGFSCQTCAKGGGFRTVDVFYKGVLSIEVRYETIPVHGWTEVDYIYVDKEGNEQIFTEIYDSWTKQEPRFQEGGKRSYWIQEGMRKRDEFMDWYDEGLGF